MSLLDIGGGGMIIYQTLSPGFPGWGVGGWGGGVPNFVTWISWVGGGGRGWGGRRWGMNRREDMNVIYCASQ